MLLGGPCIVHLSHPLISFKPAFVVVLIKKGEVGEEGRWIVKRKKRKDKSLLLSFSFHSLAYSNIPPMDYLYSLSLCWAHQRWLTSFMTYFLKPLGSFCVLLESSHMAPTHHSAAYATFPDASCWFASHLLFFSSRSFPLKIGPKSFYKEGEILPYWLQLLPVILFPRPLLILFSLPHCYFWNCLVLPTQGSTYLYL